MIQKKQLLSDDAKKSYMKLVYAGVSAAALLVLGWFAFHSYKVYQGKRAQRILGESLQEFQTAMNTVQPQWGEVQLMNELGAQQTSGAALHPFFLVMQAQAAAQQHKIDEAVVLMQQAIDGLPSYSPYKIYFALTKSLMQLDASTQEEKDKGFATLQTLAQDTANPYRDAALYHVGDFYFAVNDAAKAKEVWSQLVAQSDVFKGSPWVTLAQQKLATV